MELSGSYLRTFSISVQEHDYAKAGETTRRTPYYTIRCDCGRALDEIRVHHPDPNEKAVTLVAKGVGMYQAPGPNEDQMFKRGRRWKVLRGWTKHGRRWVCPCGQDWQRNCGKILNAIWTAGAHRPAGVQSGDRSPVVTLGTDL